MVVHPAAGHASGTLVNALLHHVDDLSGIGGEKRPGIVHRLDKGTSGLMVVAKHDKAHEELARQFAEREVEKEYLALVWGEVMAGRRIDAPIGRDPNNRKKMSSTESNRARRTRAAVTRIVRAEHFGRMLTMAQVAIHTGRTHQIRVHLSAIGHPIVGDALYGGVHRRVAGDLRAVTHLDRPFLHAAHLVFHHPEDGRQMEFTSAHAGGSAEGARRAAREVQSGDARGPLEIADCRGDCRFMQIVYKGRVFSVEAGTRRFPNGQEHDVEIVRHAASVVLIPVEDDGRVVIVKQYRAPLDRETWEFPAGRLNEGESAEDARAPRVRGGDRPRAAPPRAAGRPLSRAGILRRGADLLPRDGSAHAAAGLAAQAGRRTRTSPRGPSPWPRRARCWRAARSSI